SYVSAKVEQTTYKRNRQHLVSSTNLNAQDELKAKAAASETVSMVTPEKFQDFATDNVGKEVEIEGMVIHVCKHGGKENVHHR
ncbi:MAG: hypothetical protein MZV49_04970, partial [Rhodopseudomonas palustris]|nr:hypothetical protein [Rhodopseudomonas palustris]